jgi:hypothetical protein
MLTWPCSISNSKFNFLITACWLLIVSEAFVSCRRKYSISLLSITWSDGDILLALSTARFTELQPTPLAYKVKNHGGEYRNINASITLLSLGVYAMMLQTSWHDHPILSPVYSFPVESVEQ